MQAAIKNCVNATNRQEKSPLEQLITACRSAEALAEGGQAGDCSQRKRYCAPLSRDPSVCAPSLLDSGPREEISREKLGRESAFGEITAEAKRILCNSRIMHEGIQDVASMICPFTRQGLVKRVNAAKIQAKLEWQKEVRASQPLCAGENVCNSGLRYDAVVYNASEASGNLHRGIMQALSASRSLRAPGALALIARFESVNPQIGNRKIGEEFRIPRHCFMQSPNGKRRLDGTYALQILREAAMAPDLWNEQAKRRQMRHFQESERRADAANYRFFEVVSFQETSFADPDTSPCAFLRIESKTALPHGESLRRRFIKAASGASVMFAQNFLAKNYAHSVLNAAAEGSLNCQCLVQAGCPPPSDKG